MKILLLGDVMGPSGRKVIENNLTKLIDEYDIDFTVINGENAADDGKVLLKQLQRIFFHLVLM